MSVKKSTEAGYVTKTDDVKKQSETKSSKPSKHEEKKPKDIESEKVVAADKKIGKCNVCEQKDFGRENVRLLRDTRNISRIKRQLVIQKLP